MTVEVTRGSLVESVHRVHWAVADATGRLLDSEGDVDVPVFLRSASKPFQAISVIAGGAADAYGFTPPEIAILGGSHHGEPAHIAAVLSILKKSGVPVSALRCGAHVPYNSAARESLAGAAPDSLHSNCSGKHAGLLALARYLGKPLDTYLERDHPTQDAVFGAIAAFCDMDAGTIPYGVDGCSLPAVAVPLRNAAIGFARFAVPPAGMGPWADAANRLREAQHAFPLMVAGAESFNTHLLQEAPHLCGKSGAEGVFCVGDTRSGRGLALKVLDGANRAVPTATVALLTRLGWLDADAMSTYRSPVILSVAGQEVGRIRVPSE